MKSSVTVFASALSNLILAAFTDAAIIEIDIFNAPGRHSPSPEAAQSSRLLLSSVIAKGFEQDGTPGFTPSLTSNNNFINFCALYPKMNITNGRLINEGSCNQTPMGLLASIDNMPSVKFVYPKNGGTVAPNTNFTVQMAVRHLTTGWASNALTNFYAAPQTLDAATNDIQGHSHVVIDRLPALDSTAPTDPKNDFVFFAALGEPAKDGILSVTVGGGLPMGTYRMASVNVATNHQPVLVAPAQHGALDDMV
ncbi:uncharacterized protein BXZ73DRAFT_41333 [Epithele typhae]|uniref:uncharacterized protein n=1 Tax=Epithele typhae TaxID=378194 RepID=UPI00200782A8|nr:uncharacterized protein BXZ73DRAFT_41333 [Epithele typhae]KAH9942281.1 hypothetical protein BXZ73DRAFT_41333 [Epithele typhae]